MELQNHRHFRCAHTLLCLGARVSTRESRLPWRAPRWPSQRPWHVTLESQHLGLPDGPALWATCPPSIGEFGGPLPLRGSLTTQVPGKMLVHSIILQCFYKKHLVSVDTPMRLFSQRAGMEFHQISIGSAYCAFFMSIHSGAEQTWAYLLGEPSQGARLAKMLPCGNLKDNGRREPTSTARKCRMLA